MTSIHGHEVLAMMHDNSYHSDEELLDAVINKFGSQAKFHTCSKQDMTAAELIAFLKARGKFKPADGNSFTVNPDRICNH